MVLCSADIKLYILRIAFRVSSSLDVYSLYRIAPPEVVRVSVVAVTSVVAVNDSTSTATKQLGLHVVTTTLLRGRGGYKIGWISSSLRQVKSQVCCFNSSMKVLNCTRLNYTIEFTRLSILGKHSKQK